MDQTRELKYSVKRGDDNGVIQFIMPSYLFNNAPALPPTLPRTNDLIFAGYNNPRDQVLLSTPRFEAQWASAIGIAIAKMVSMAFEIESDGPRLRGKAQHWLLNAGADMGLFGWVPFLSMHLRSYLGAGRAFVEIERATPARGSKVINIHHLDPLRCRLTGDPQEPVYYLSNDNQERPLKWYEVMPIIDLPDPTGGQDGQAFSATERAYGQIIKLAAIERYVYEKVSGQRPLALYFLGGASQRWVEDAIEGAKEDAARRNLTSYMGAAVKPIPGDVPLNLVEIPLAELPDGFDPERERNRADLIYSNAIGLDPQDINPELVGRQGLGSTGNQSLVLADKSKGRGLAAWRQQFTHNLNELALSDKVLFTFSEIDLRDEEVAAGIKKTRAEARKTQVESGEITPEQATNLAVDEGDLPREFVRADITAGGTLTDTDKPEAEGEMPDDTGMVPVEDEAESDDTVKEWSGVY